MTIGDDENLNGLLLLLAARSVLVAFCEGGESMAKVVVLRSNIPQSPPPLTPSIPLLIGIWRGLRWGESYL